MLVNISQRENEIVKKALSVYLLNAYCFLPYEERTVLNNEIERLEIKMRNVFEAKSKDER